MTFADSGNEMRAIVCPPACSVTDMQPRDDEFLEIYTQMRRRPDGKSLGPLHDVIWQSAALVLGQSPWSEEEYTAVFGQMARSARHFRLFPSSRNYFEHILKPMIAAK